MAANSDLIPLTPLDHIPAKIYLPYILFFDAPDPNAAVQTIQNGIQSLVAQLPWLAGDVTFHSEPSGPQNRGHIVPPRSAPRDVPMLQVKNFERDEDVHANPVQAYLPVPCFIPASKQRPVLRFQANVFPSKIVLVMSYMHLVIDGTGAGIILEALSQNCKDGKGSVIAQAIAEGEFSLRNEISSWPSKCQTRLDHSAELGVPAFPSDLTSEQWAGMEAAMSAAVQTKRFTFSPAKVAQLKDLCSKQYLPEVLKQQQNDASSTFISSNDLITAILAISVDRAQHASRQVPKSASLTMAVDLRSRVNPPLPDTFLGNMIYPVRNDIYFPDLPQSSSSSSPDTDADLLHLTRLALQLRNKLGSMTETLAYSTAAEVVAQGDWTKTEGKPADVIVTSWRHLKLLGLDFGAGLSKPVDFEAGLSLIPGACIFMPAKATASGEVPWEIAVTLSPDAFAALEGDALVGRILA